jgi:hypothetical protein
MGPRVISHLMGWHLSLPHRPFLCVLSPTSNHSKASITGFKFINDVGGASSPMGIWHTLPQALMWFKVLYASCPVAGTCVKVQ